MSDLGDICSHYVTTRDSQETPAINAVIAGYTDRQKTKFLTAKGVKNIETKEPVSADSMLCFFSCTKPMTAMAILILWDRGRIDLDAPAKVYLPILGEFGVVHDEQVDIDTGDLKYPPKRAQVDVTVRHLLLHTSGFAYIFTDNIYLKIMSKKRIHAGKPSRKLFDPSIMPLVFEPGTAWTYGHSYDWLGLIVEAVSGKSLSQFLQEYVFAKADMSHCTFQMNDPSSLVSLHDKSDDELKIFESRPPVPFDSPIDMGGQGCFGTVGDYLKFLRIWLNKGVSPDTGARIMTREAVEYAIQNHLAAGLNSDFPMPLADTNDGFSLIGCAYKGKLSKTGRPVGSLCWSGLANMYFWLDLENGCAGFWGCQIMPYMDEACVQGFIDFESAVHSKVLGKDSKL